MQAMGWGKIPGEEDTGIAAPKRHLLMSTAMGLVGGYVLLHPLSMLILSVTTGHGPAHAAPIREAFSAHHVPMALFFAALGGIIGFLFGLSQLRLRRLCKAAVEIARVDGLTKIYNRRYFDDQLVREVARSRRSGQPLSLLVIDLDGFKAFNDARGHPQGDRVLQEAAEVFRAMIRTVDVVARLGGDEFAVLLPQTARQEAVAAAERIRVSFATATANELPPVSLSIGVAEMPGEANDEDGLLSRADQAVYQAKRGGRNCVRASDAGPQLWPQPRQDIDTLNPA